MSVKLDRKTKRLLAEPLGVLGLSVRTTNGLENAGLLTVEDLLNSCPHRPGFCNESRAKNRGVCPCRQVFAAGDAQRRTFEPTCYLLGVANLGEKTLQEVRDRLSERGLV